MPRHVLLLDLKSDPQAWNLYREWHKSGAVPAQIVRSIRRSGISDMEIFNFHDRLVMVIEVDESFSFAEKSKNDADNPEVVAWEGKMDLVQHKLPGAPPGGKWVEADLIFSLRDYEVES